MSEIEKGGRQGHERKRTRQVGKSGKCGRKEYEATMQKEEEEGSKEIVTITVSKKHVFFIDQLTSVSKPLEATSVQRRIRAFSL